MREFLRLLTSVYLTEDILDYAVKIRQNRVKLADALIASCAIKEEAILVTRNIKDFQKINQLIVYNPFDIF